MKISTIAFHSALGMILLDPTTIAATSETLDIEWKNGFHIESFQAIDGEFGSFCVRAGWKGGIYRSKYVFKECGMDSGDYGAYFKAPFEVWWCDDSDCNSNSCSKRYDSFWSFPEDFDGKGVGPFLNAGDDPAKDSEEFTAVSPELLTFWSILTGNSCVEFPDGANTVSSEGQP